MQVLPSAGWRKPHGQKPRHAEELDEGQQQVPSWTAAPSSLRHHPGSRRKRGNEGQRHRLKRLDKAGQNCPHPATRKHLVHTLHILSQTRGLAPRHKLHILSHAGGFDNVGRIFRPRLQTLLARGRDIESAFRTANGAREGATTGGVYLAPRNVAPDRRHQARG